MRLKYGANYVIIIFMKKRLLLIGGGTIATHYKAGLTNSPHYELAALADVNPDCASRKLYDVPFFTDYASALATGAEVAMISTSTSSHYAIARDLLERGIDVICEKPLCENYDKILALHTLANAKKRDLGCLFHWIYADEVRWLTSHKKELGCIKKITVHICDDYAHTDDGAIRTDRKGLCGAWLDSGINVLSYVGQLCDLHDYELVDEENILDGATGQVKFAHRIYRFGQTLADITVDWRTASRQKLSEIQCELGTVQVNHTLQTVSLGGVTLYGNTIDDRLTGHYVNAFAEYELNKGAQQRTLLLHKILFEGGAR